MSDESEFKGASNNERLLAAARSDNEELLLEVFEQKGSFDINCQDGLGNTPLHNAVLHASTDVLEHILSHDDCDVDPLNRLDRATPLHLAVQLDDPELRLHVVQSLLDAGADTTCVLLISLHYSPPTLPSALLHDSIYFLGVWWCGHITRDVWTDEVNPQDQRQERLHSPRPRITRRHSRDIRHPESEGGQRGVQTRHRRRRRRRARFGFRLRLGLRVGGCSST